MYRQFNWATRASPPSRRLSCSSSFDLGSGSPFNSFRATDFKEGDSKLLLSQASCVHPPLHFTPAKSSSIIYREPIDNDLLYVFPVEEIINHTKTDFQDLKILKTKHFGKLLVLDDHVQSAESDECVYHESLVHPAMLSHPNPETVFIGGGGELATVREVLKYKTVTKVVMVDIDKKAVQICKEHLGEWNENVLDDPRVELIYGDADAFLKTCGLKFDVIIMDICDPTEYGPGWKLYTKEFYQGVKDENMNGPHAVFCTQSTSVNVNTIILCFSIIYNTLRSVFAEVNPYKCDIPSFGTLWGFQLCCDEKTHLLGPSVNPESIDEEIRSEHRLGETGERSLRHYNGSCHLHMFNLTKFEKEACEDEGRIFTLDSPVYIP